jgi:nucleotide-binding universal stress UspA family protein
MIKSILVPVDGSEHANVAVDWASELSVKFGAPLILLHVVREPPGAELPEDLRHFAELEQMSLALKSVWTSIGQEIADKATARAGAKGAKQIETVVEVGDPSRTIVDYAKRRNVDLIVMGRRGLGDVKGLLLGSVSHKVAHLADCACMTVK